MVTARRMQLCDLSVVRLLLRHRPSWMFKPLDGIITPGMAHQSFWPIYMGLRTVEQSVLAEVLLAQSQVSSSLYEDRRDWKHEEMFAQRQVH